MAGGRPSKYEEHFPDRVIELMTDGAGKEEVGADLGISMPTLYEWANPESPYFKEEFSKAIKLGEQLCIAWWMRKGREAAAGKVENFNATAWVFNMKNRWGWKDKTETEHVGPNGGAIKTEMVIRFVDNAG